MIVIAFARENHQRIDDLMEWEPDQFFGFLDASTELNKLIEEERKKAAKKGR